MVKSITIHESKICVKEGAFYLISLTGVVLFLKKSMADSIIVVAISLLSSARTPVRSNACGNNQIPTIHLILYFTLQIPTLCVHTQTYVLRQYNVIINGIVLIIHWRHVQHVVT